MTAAALAEIHFDSAGLVPVIAQEAVTGEVLMLAWADREALERTVATGAAHYHSRRRAALWRKGESSGHVQQVREVRVDCDGDAVLYLVDQSGPACHTGERNCFHKTPSGARVEPLAGPVGGGLDRLHVTIAERIRTLPEGSYVAALVRGGQDRVLRKIAEEAGEVVIAGKNADPAELTREAADLVFHLLVALAMAGVGPAGLAAELEARRRAPPEDADKG